MSLIKGLLERRGREDTRGRSPHQNMREEGCVAQKELQCPFWGAVNLWGPQREGTSEKWVSQSYSLAFTSLVLGPPNLEPCTGEASFRSVPSAQNIVEGRRVLIWWGQREGRYPVCSHILYTMQQGFLPLLGGDTSAS